jgi:hypothetical protein
MHCCSVLFCSVLIWPVSKVLQIGDSGDDGRVAQGSAEPSVSRACQEAG